MKIKGKMENKYLLLVFILQSALLTSCLGGSDYYRDRVAPFLKELKPNYKPQMFDGVMEPEFPDLDEGKETLEGIDSNKDGVRDDMEIFINRNFDTWVERDNLKNTYKRAPEFFRNYKNMSADQQIIYDSNSSYDLKCILSGLSRLGLKSSPELVKFRSAEALYNTDERRSAFSHNYQKLAGRAYGDGYGDEKIIDMCTRAYDKELLKKEGR